METKRKTKERDNCLQADYYSTGT